MSWYKSRIPYIRSALVTIVEECSICTECRSSNVVQQVGGCRCQRRAAQVEFSERLEDTRELLLEKGSSTPQPC